MSAFKDLDDLPINWSDHEDIAIKLYERFGEDLNEGKIYRIRFTESVSGLAVGEAVKYRGVDVGTVKSLALDANDPQLVDVRVNLRKETPVKIDTKATLKLKGITGNLFIELNGGAAKSTALLAATKDGEMPVIASEKSSLTTAIEQLPRVVEKFSAVEDQAKKVLTDVSAFTAKVKENPSLLLRRPKETNKPAETVAPGK